MMRNPDLEVSRPTSRTAWALFQMIGILGVVFLLAYAWFSRAPGTVPAPKEAAKHVTTNSASSESSVRLRDAADLCERIPEIKLIPFHRDRGEDSTYDAFMDAGEAAVPCLIEQITNTTRTPDPRETLKFPETTVGDLAYFLIVDITKLDFTELLPREVQADFKDNGVWAYHAYVAKTEHREDLQHRLYEWYFKRRSTPRPMAKQTLPN